MRRHTRFFASFRAHRSIIPGIVIVIFFQCTGALFNPANRTKEGIKWLPVTHAAVMFSFVAVCAGVVLGLQSVSFVDNRTFPGIGGLVFPGPLGCRLFVYYKAINLVPNLTVLLNNWLADGLLVSSVRIQSLVYLTQAIPALSLLHYLRQELLYHRLSLPDVPCIRGYHLQKLITGQRLQRPRGWRCNPILFDLDLTQHPPYPFNYFSTYRTQQEHLGGRG